ncbi:MAG: GNAT family N-acetyltransferase [Pseudomonadota bacterium]
MDNTNSLGLSRVERRLSGYAENTGIESIIYDNEIPSFVETALERLYGNIYSSLAEFHITGAIKDASTYVLRKHGTLVALFLFRREKRKLVVLNEVISVSQEDIYYFASYVFSILDGVDAIVFGAIETDIRMLSFPFQRFNYSEDIVVPLPNTEQAYLASLGPATRKNLSRHRNRLIRDFPSFCYRSFVRGEASEQHIRAIVKFNWDRMARKNKRSGIDEQRTQRLLALVNAHGFVWIATIDGRICAGAICLNVGPQYFMEISSHDYAYDQYRLGTLCCCLALCACIERGGHQLHLLWGRYDYKYMLGGMQRDLDKVIVYRNSSGLLRNGDLAAKAAIQNVIRKIKLWLQGQKNERGFFAASIVRAVNILRSAKRFIH